MTGKQFRTKIREIFTKFSPVYRLVKRFQVIACQVSGGKSTGINAVPPMKGTAGKPETYLSAFVRFKNEARYLPEFLCFHLAVGVEHFYLYNNNSTDDYAAVLKPFLDAGLVTLVDWPAKPASPSADIDCVQRCRGKTRWLACFDADEFLFPVQADDLKAILREYEGYPALVANWKLFGSFGHQTPPPGLVIESYLGCDEALNRHVKSIIDPLRVVAYGNSHYWLYRGWRQGVDENRREVLGSFVSDPTANAIQVNHYIVKSREDLLAKRDPNYGVDVMGLTLNPRALTDLDEQLASHNDARDPSILRFVEPTKAVAAKLGVRLGDKQGVRLE